MNFDAGRARELLSLHRPYHSELQIDHFITGRAGLTTWGMFLQALRELNGRFEGMKSLSAERRLADIERRRQERLASDAKDGLDGEEAEVRAEQAAMRLDSIDRNIRDTWRELQRFYAQAVALRARLPAELTAEVRDELERERWVALLKRAAALDITATGNVSAGTRDSIWALPMAQRALVLQAVSKPGELLAECTEFEPDVPVTPLPAILEGDVVKLLEACGA